MSLLNSIKTLQLDPVIFNQQRCEFRLDPKLYLSNWRLADIRSVSSSDGTADNIKGNPYVVGAGAYALIQSIVLYNDSTVIANLYNASDYLSFANQGRTNGNSANMARILTRNNVGYQFSVDTDSTRIETAEPMRTRDELYPIPSNNRIQDSDNATERAWLDLSLPLPFLKSTPVVNGQQLRDLRLVIEWAPHSSISDINALVDGNIVNGKLSIQRPILIVDEMIDPRAIAKVKNAPVSYINLDSERVVVGSGATNIQQRLRAFDDRTVNRILVANKTGTLNEKYGLNYSAAMFGEKMQLVLNGQNLIPYQGIDSEMKKQAYLSDTWGLRNQPQTSQLFDALGHTDIVSLEGYGGTLSYGGLNVSQEVDELLLDYQRKSYNPVAVALSAITDANPAVITVASPLYLGDGTKLNIVGATAGQSGAVNGERDVTADAADPTKFTLTGVDTGAGGTVVTAATATVITNKTAASTAGFDMLFWGEVAKVMSVSDNKVSIKM